jgi:hypothetical protein
MVSNCEDLSAVVELNDWNQWRLFQVDSKGLNKGGGANGTWPNMIIIHDPKRKMQKILFIAGPPVYA